MMAADPIITLEGLIDIMAAAIIGLTKASGPRREDLKHMCFAHQVRSLFVGLLLCFSATSDAADSSRLKTRGKAILQEKCGRCHAIEAAGESPLKQAPPMRDIYARFAPRELQAELREGMVSKHRTMPQIDFSDEDVDAILAYLYALAIKK
jgi:mono/diheme cytochrome c family protein